MDGERWSSDEAGAFMNPGVSTQGGGYISMSSVLWMWTRGYHGPSCCEASLLVAEPLCCPAGKEERRRTGFEGEGL